MAVVPTPYEMPASGVINSSGFNEGVQTALRFLLKPPLAVLRQTVAQSIPNNTWTSVTMDVEDYDQDYLGAAAQHSTSSNTSRFTAVWAGQYWVTGAGQFALNTTGSRGTRWAVNGSAINAGGALLPTVSASFGTGVPAPGQLLFLAFGDYVELQVFQNSGGALNTGVTASGQSGMSVIWMSN